MIFDFSGFNAEPDIWEFPDVTGVAPVVEAAAMAKNCRLTVPISVSASGANEIVAAEAGVIVRVIGFYMSAAGAVTATWKSASTGLTGAMSMITGVPLGAVAPPGYPNDQCLFATAPGEALNLTLSGAVAVGGFVLVQQISVTP